MLTGAVAQTSIGPGPTVVHTRFGGFILGYDIDQNGTEGVLAEALSLGDGNYNVAVETFDQKTGKIIKLVSGKKETLNDFVVLGIVQNQVGLVEAEIVKNLVVSKRVYRVINPITANQFTGLWTPPLLSSDIITGVGRSQGSSSTAFLGFHNRGDFSTFVFSSDVAANTFGPTVSLTDPNFFFSHVPVIALDSVNNQAVVAAQGANAFGPPALAQVDLTTGTITEFNGVGIGIVNGIAVDSADGIACTTTEIDFSIEIYNLKTRTGFVVPLPGAVSQAQSGAGVAFDPINKLFLVAQPMTSTAASGSSIQVFDLNGNFIESLNGFSLPASSTLIALHPSDRTGYILTAPDLTSLQSFSY